MLSKVHKENTKLNNKKLNKHIKHGKSDEYIFHKRNCTNCYRHLNMHYPFSIIREIQIKMMRNNIAQ